MWLDNQCPPPNYRLKKVNKLTSTKTYADALAAIGEPVKNTDLVNAVLCGLGSEYEMLITALESHETLPQFSALRSQLLIYESHHRASAPLGLSALLASLAFSQNSHMGKKDAPGILGAHPTVGSCQLCHGIGHFATTCPMLPRFSRPQVLGSLHSTFAGLHIASPALQQPSYSGGPSGYTPQQAYDPVYYLDTRVSTYMTGDSTYLHQRTPYTGPDSILRGNGPL
ncbi:hypothetical protein IFM89_030615 [Coptis chinensis]|uniref:Uncharacterized protein n=1 Tax=Coptis chinensis TaxID=261450 RepID=A0A835HR00_9MAGN|nr:hypothetical protein IFM89_030615 [Coptis chinensis]